MRGAVPLSEGLCFTHLLINSPRRCPLNPQGPCIEIEGDRITKLGMDQFTTDQVDAVEFYPRNADISGILKPPHCDNSRQEVMIIWLRRDR